MTKLRIREKIKINVGSPPKISREREHNTNLEKETSRRKRRREHIRCCRTAGHGVERRHIELPHEPGEGNQQEKTAEGTHPLLQDSRPRRRTAAHRVASRTRRRKPAGENGGGNTSVAAGQPATASNG